MNLTYGALDVVLPAKITTDSYKNQGELIIVNLKAGSTCRTAQKRMSDHHSSFANCRETTYSVGNEAWTNDVKGAYSNIGEGELFYQRKVRNFREAEQRLINTNRKICKEYAGGQVKVVLHHGLPHDNRSNPAPYEKGINPSYYRLVKKIIKEKMKEAIKALPDSDSRVIKLKSQIAESQDKLNQLVLDFSEQQKELLEIKI